MNIALLIPFVTFFMVISTNIPAASIFLCEQPDGTIEFTNKGCSKSNSLRSKRTYHRDFTRVHITSVNKKGGKKRIRHRALFTRPGFIKLQNKLLGAQSLAEMEEYAQTIISKVRASAQQGKINAAYDMVAATYAKLSKDMKKRQWKSQSISEYTIKTKTLFEEILITQSMISTTTEMEQAIHLAWENYRSSPT